MDKTAATVEDRSRINHGSNMHVLKIWLIVIECESIMDAFIEMDNNFGFV